MKIVADENIPGLDEYFSFLGDITPINGRKIAKSDLVDADILLVRSVTQVNADLLDNTSVKFVASATTGTDHIDEAYLARNSIGFSHAAGANANSVVEYVIAALCHLSPKIGPLNNKSVAIIGCGNVGGSLYKRLSEFGLDVVTYDPLLEKMDYPYRRVSFSEALDRDIICLHTPLTHDGAFPTHHLIDASAIEKIRPGAVLINAGRGAVIDNEALLKRLKQPQPFHCVLDVWEHEPQVDLQLLGFCDLATPHIAGYSLDGKIGGTRMVAEAASAYFGRPFDSAIKEEKGKKLHLYTQDTWQAVCSAVRASYDIMADDQRFRQEMNLPNFTQNIPDRFDLYRKNYPVRREWGYYSVDISTREDKHTLKPLLEGAGFHVISNDTKTETTVGDNPENHKTPDVDNNTLNRDNVSKFTGLKTEKATRLRSV